MALPTCPRTARPARPGPAMAVLMTLLTTLLPASPAPASYQYAYTVQDLGTPGQLFPFAYSALGINNSGQVVGTLLTAEWTQSAYRGSAGGVTALGTFAGGGGDSQGLAINGGGTVAGSALKNGRTHAFRGSPGGLEDLGLVLHRRGEPGTIQAVSTVATGINGSNQVVGVARLTNGSFRAFVSEDAPGGGTKLVDLGLLPGWTGSKAAAVNGEGTIVGTAETASGQARAWVARASGTGFTLEALDQPAAANGSYAMAVNASGRVAGYALFGNVAHAVRTDLGSNTLVDLGTLADGGDTRALAMNSLGDLVGSSILGSSSRAILYRDATGRFENLNALLDPNSGWYLRSATGINDRGQIVGVGSFGGYDRAFLLTPTAVPVIPEPSAALLLALGGLGLLARRRLGLRP